MKLYILFALGFLISLNVSAQLEGKKFSTGEGVNIVQLEFTNSKYLLQTPDLLSLVKGVFEQKGDTIIFTDLGGYMACPKEQKGIYTFKYENKELKLTLVEEQCNGRKGMALAKWKEVEKKLPIP